VLELGPRASCHLDLHPGNLFATAGQIVLIPLWTLVPRSFGKDAGNLMVGAVFGFFAPRLFHSVWRRPSRWAT